VGDLEHAALALQVRKRRFAADVGDVLAKDDHLLVPRHLLVQARVQEVHHRLGIAGRPRLGVERIRGRIDLRRVDVVGGALRRRYGGGEGGVGGLVDLAIGILAQAGEILGRRHPVRDQAGGKADQRIALRVRLTLRDRPVVGLVVAQ
jgi:hypothetical protein